MNNIIKKNEHQTTVAKYNDKFYIIQSYIGPDDNMLNTAIIAICESIDDAEYIAEKLNK